MAIEQRISYTVLPNGVSNGKHRFSVLISPRLKRTSVAGKPVAGTLDMFDGWVDWPSTVRSHRWTLNLQDSKGKMSKVTPALAAGATAPSSQHWAALFAADTEVKPFLFKELDEAVFSYPTDHVLEYMSNKFADLAQVVDPPPVAQLRQAYAEIDVLNEKSETLNVGKQIQTLFDRLDSKSAIRRSSVAKPAQDFTQAALFHAPTLNPQKAAANKTVGAGTNKLPKLDDFFKVDRPNRPTPPEFDFHQTVALLSQHPLLMRLLGLVVDFEFVSPFGTGDVEVNASLTVSSGSRSKIHGPTVETIAIIGPSRFAARPESSKSEVQNGLLHLGSKLPDGTPEYMLVDTDVDGAALKTLNFVNELARSQEAENETGDEPQDQLPPSFRSAGISIVRKNRGESLQKAFARQTSLNRTFAKGEAANGDSVQLYAEDLTRGYAFDVFDAHAGQWFSLCAREGVARFGPDPDNPQLQVPLPPADGWVGTAVTQGLSVGDETVKVPESMARWANGWSMVTKRPGRTVGNAEEPVDYSPQLTNVPLSVEYATPPGTLPLQRYGRAYKVRGRAVDLAGNAMSSEAANALGSTDTLSTPGYRRAEPVSPPTVLMRNQVTQGESTHRVVVRSNRRTPAGATVPSERHIFPPSLDQFRTECHGVWDSGVNRLNPAQSYEQILARERGSYAGPDAFGNPHAGTQPDPKNHDAPYNTLADPVYVVENGTPAPMPNLPDPVSSGVTFKSLPGAGSDELHTESFYRGNASWPAVTPIRLHVFESDEFVPPQLVGRELRVGLPKAEMIDVKMSSYLDPEDLDIFKPYELLQAIGAVTPQLQAQIVAGEHWGFTPPRRLKLVHAVRQPLEATIFTESLRIERSEGQTFVTLKDTMRTSRRSSERVDVTGTWSEITDYVDPRTGLWSPRRIVPVTGPAFQRKIEFDREADSELPIEERHELRHTRHIAEMRYDTVAATRYRAYFTEQRNLDFRVSQTAVLGSDYTGAAAGDVGVIPNSETISSTVGTTTYRRGTHYSINYDTGLITRLAGTLSPMPKQVRATYVVPPDSLASDDSTRVRILSSARPAAPKALYAVPNFKWERVEGSSERRSKRGGGSLRVYLDRPWWSSGEGEQLAVVCLPAPIRGAKDTLPPELAPYVSQRGQDPIWDGTRTSQLPRAKDFTNATATHGGLRIAELTGDARVAAAVFDVSPLEVEEGGAPNSDNPRWYCDIDLAPGSAYTPFIRLALARFQEHSITGVELSQIVLLDYIQLMPDRVATVVRNGNQASVSVSGRSYFGGGESVPANSVVEVTLETRRSGMESGEEAVGWVPVAQPLELDSNTGFTGSTTWTGGITVPSGGGRYRIALREYEQFAPSAGTSLDRRIVYADAIAL